MIIVREVFIAKPGMASKLATLFKAEMGRNSKILTDMTGAFNKVVVETEYENMTAFDREMQEYTKQPKPTGDPSKPNYTEMFIQGKREIFRVW